MIAEHSYKGHQISQGRILRIRRDSLGRPWAVITKARRHCLTITGRLSGSHDRADPKSPYPRPTNPPLGGTPALEVKGAALDAVTRSVPPRGDPSNGVPWSAHPKNPSLGFPVGPRGRLIRELEP